MSGSQIYRKDTVTGEVALVSSNSSGAQINSSANFGSISADGRYAIFSTDATNLISGVSGSQVYRKDMQTGEVVLVSSNFTGAQSSGGYSLGTSISADGRYVILSSDSTNLVSGVSGGQTYRKDIQTGEVLLVSSSSSGTQANSFVGFGSMSADGRYVVFNSDSTNLISGVSGMQAYRKDLITGEMMLVSSASSGTQGDGDSDASISSITADGRYAIFTSNSTNLISGVSGTQTYRKDLTTGEIILVSSDSSGVQDNGDSRIASISSDGRYAVFTSSGSSLVSGASGYQVYRKDLITGEIELVSRSTSGEQDSNNGIDPDSYIYGLISADGSKVFFSSNSDNLISGDTNGSAGLDIFYRDMSKVGIDELSGMVVSNQGSSKVTLMLAKERLEKINLAKAKVGAISSRISSALSNLSTSTENISAASSQITDADIAQEAAKLVASQILQQVGASILSIANVQPEITLKLLQNIDIKGKG